MNNICVDLETAKKLFGIGRGKYGRNATRFTYRPNKSERPQAINEYHEFYNYATILGENYFYAPTTQELLDVLPQLVVKEKGEEYGVWRYPEIIKYGDCVRANYPHLVSIEGRNMTEALADLVLRCVENGYLSFDNTND